MIIVVGITVFISGLLVALAPRSDGMVAIGLNPMSMTISILIFIVGSSPIFLEAAVNHLVDPLYELLVRLLTLGGE